MIATFRSESKRALWMALVLTIAVISLTDATAGEQREQVMILKEPPSPEAEAVMQKLDQTVTFELSGASIEDVIHAVSNRTGVTFTVAEGAIGDSARATKYNVLKATNVPAHIVLLESLHAADLALRFDANGATIEKMEEGEHRIMIRKADGAAGHERMFVQKRSAKSGDSDVLTFERRIQRDGKEPAGEMKFERRLPRQTAEVDLDSHEAGDGVVRRKVTFRGGEGGQADGTFELEVTRDAASTQR